MPKRTTAPDRQIAFAHAYAANGFNATLAARVAGYTGSDRTLCVMGSRLLKVAKVRAVLAAAAKAHEVTTDEVLGVLVSQMRGTIEPFLDVNEETGEVRTDLVKAKKAGVLHLIKEIEDETTTYFDATNERKVTERKVKVKLYDRQSAAVHVAKILGMYVERKEVTTVRPGAMDDAKLIQELIDLGIPQSKWPPGVLRRYQARTKRVANKESK